MILSSKAYQWMYDSKDLYYYTGSYTGSDIGGYFGSILDETIMKGFLMSRPPAVEYNEFSMI